MVMVMVVLMMTHGVSGDGVDEDKSGGEDGDKKIYEIYETISQYIT